MQLNNPVYMSSLVASKRASPLKTIQLLCILTLLKETLTSLTMSVATMTGWTI